MTINALMLFWLKGLSEECLNFKLIFFFEQCVCSKKKTKTVAKKQLERSSY